MCSNLDEQYQHSTVNDFTFLTYCFVFGQVCCTLAPRPSPHCRDLRQRLGCCPYCPHLAHRCSSLTSRAHGRRHLGNRSLPFSRQSDARCFLPDLPPVGAELSSSRRVYLSSYFLVHDLFMSQYLVAWLPRNNHRLHKTMCMKHTSVPRETEPHRVPSTFTSTAY